MGITRILLACLLIIAILTLSLAVVTYESYLAPRVNSTTTLRTISTTTIISTETLTMTIPSVSPGSSTTCPASESLYSCSTETEAGYDYLQIEPPSITTVHGQNFSVQIQIQGSEIWYLVINMSTGLSLRGIPLAFQNAYNNTLCMLLSRYQNNSAPYFESCGGLGPLSSYARVPPQSVPSFVSFGVDGAGTNLPIIANASPGSLMTFKFIFSTDASGNYSMIFSVNQNPTRQPSASCFTCFTGGPLTISSS